MKCPHCHKKITVEPDRDRDMYYQPTASDPEYVDVSDYCTCVKCGGNMQIDWRYWLSDDGAWRPDNRIQFMKIKAMLPDDDEWLHSYTMCFSPDGKTLYSRGAHTWSIKLDGKRPHVGGTEIVFPFSWSSDGRLYASYERNFRFNDAWCVCFVDGKNGKITARYAATKQMLDRQGELAAGHLLPDNTFVMVYEGSFDKSNSWIYYLDVKNGSWREQILVSGNISAGDYRDWFEPGGSRLLRRYKGNIELYHIDGGSTPNATLLSKRQIKEQQVEHVCWDADGSIVIGETPISPGWAFLKIMPHAMRRLDGMTLEDCNYVPQLPEKICRLRDMRNREIGYVPYSGLYQFGAKSKRLVVVTDAIYTVSEKSGGMTSLARVSPRLFPKINRDEVESYTVTVHAASGRMAVSFRNEILVYDLVKKKLLARGSKLLRAFMKLRH